MNNGARERDQVWDALADIFGPVRPGTSAHGKRNKAVKDLKLQGATPETIAHAHRAYLAAFNCACTDMALAVHYPLFAPKAVDPPCPECGIGGGHHLADCRNVTSDLIPSM